MWVLGSASAAQITMKRIIGAAAVVPGDATNKFADDRRAAALGQFLFFDTRFSANGKFSCDSCH
jgi:cytochrome c peroxidase